MSLKDKKDFWEGTDSSLNPMFDYRDVKEAVLTTVREIYDCFTGLTADSEMECGLLTALKLIKENFGDWEDE